MVQDQQHNCWFGRVVSGNARSGTDTSPEGQLTLSGLFDSRHLSIPSHLLADNRGQATAEGSIFKLSGEFPAFESSASDNKTDGAALVAAPSIEIVATADSAGARIYSLLEKFDLNPCFPQACEEEANALIAAPGFDDPVLQDLKHLPFVTIDNADSRDLDQAIYIERGNNNATSEGAPDGDLAVYYALADASYYVRPGTALFDEALARMVTYYAPDMAIPMLPRQLSEGLISLNPGVKRRALIFKTIVQADGQLGSTEVIRGLIQSRAKLSYEGVQHFIDAARVSKQQQHKLGNQEFSDSLLLLETVGERRINEARERNVISYNRREASVSIDDGDRFVITQRERFDSERYNEQVSLLCNMEGARLLAQGARLLAQGARALSQQQGKHPELHSIYRIHAAPLQQRMQHLRDDINQLITAHGKESEWRWQQNQRLDTYLEGLPAEKEHAALRQVIERMILLTNQASLFDDEPGPHHALGVEYYARFSAPMREMVGVFVHKELLEMLEFEIATQSSIDSGLQQTIIEQSNLSRKRQKKLQQEARLLAIRQYFHDDLVLEFTERPNRSGTIMGMRGGKIYIAIDGFGADVKMYTDDLGEHFGCRYKVEGVRAVPQNDDGGAPTLTSGDRLTIKTLRYDDKRSRFVFIPDF